VAYGYLDANGNPTSNLTSAKDLNGNTWTFAYDSQHELTVMKTPVCAATPGCNGIVNVYNGGRVMSQTDAMGRITTFAYSNGTTTITDPRGNVTVDEYQNNLLMSETKASGTGAQATWTYQYDPAALSLIQVVDPNGHATTSVRDAQARLIVSTDARGSTTQHTYNAFGQALTTTDPMGTITTNTYDSAGNITQSATPLTGTGQTRITVYSYQDASHPGDLTRMTDAGGKIWLYSYDQYGNRVSATDPIGNVTTYESDLAGRMTSKVMPRGNATGGTPSAYTWVYTYDGSGHLLSTTDPLTLHPTTNQYDGDGNLTMVTDQNGHWTQFTFDLDEEVTNVTRFDGSTQQTVHDANGNILKQIDGRNQATVYTYDQQNRKASVTDPLNRVTTYSYDEAGNLISITDANGHQTSYAYDAGNELTSVSYQLAQPVDVQFAYDKAGRRLSMADGTGISTNQYDSLSRMTRSVNGAGASVGFGYDLMGRITSIAYPGGIGSVTRTYYDNGSLHSVSDWLGHTTTFSYDADSNLVGASYPNGITLAVGVDAAERISTITDSQNASQILSFSYSRDNVGQLTGDGGNTYSYDSINRLTGGTMATYQYDAADRLTQMTPSGGNVNTLGYDNADQLATATTAAGGSQVSQVTYAFDANGNRLSQTNQIGQQTVLVWDQANHLMGYGTSTYVYDGGGLRASKTVAGNTEAYVWDAAEGLPLVIQDGSTYYITGPGGLPLEQINGPTVSYYHEDQQGSVRGVTDASGNLVHSYTYDPYGNVIGATGTLNNPFMYGGQYQDLDTGLYYLRARYYDPTTACFLSRDPAVATTREPYAYVSDSPLNSVDPSGLDGWGWIQDRLVDVGRALPGPARSAYVGGLTQAGNFLGAFQQGNTQGVCFSVSVNVIVWGAFVNACAVVSYDANGNPKGFGTTETYGTGPGAGLGGGGMLSYQRSNAENISDLGGGFVYTNACGGDVVAVGGGASSGISRGKVVAVGEIGVGPGGGAYGQVGVSNTNTQTWIGS